MSLREELAWRLEACSNLDGPDGDGMNAGGEVEMAGWLYVADECIRQMEWAWRTGFDSCCNRGMLPSPPPDPKYGDYSVHLAPEDWRATQND